MGPPYQLASDLISLPLIKLDMRVLKTILKQLSTDKYHTIKFTIIIYTLSKSIHNLLIFTPELYANQQFPLCQHHVEEKTKQFLQEQSPLHHHEFTSQFLLCSMMKKMKYQYCICNGRLLTFPITLAQTELVQKGKDHRFYRLNYIGGPLSYLTVTNWSFKFFFGTN
jgi:hypothetical protein